MDRYYKPGDEPVPRFVLRRKLGKGAFGEVWKATTKSGVNVALKIISLENKGGLKEFRAIRTVKNIHHPNLVPIVDIWLRDAEGNLIDDAGEDDSGIIRDTAAELFIAMGLGEKNLLDRLKECQKQGRTGIPPEELLRYMEDAARAIDYLNFPQSDSERAAIQHCDIKPGNIMMVGGSAQVCDFGLARVLGSDARATRQGDHMSVPYTAPELFWDASKPSQWSDQYSLAVTYVELRTGNLPFEHVTPAGMMFAHTQGKLDLSKLPALEQAVIRRGTSVEAVKRFPTTMEMVQELRRAFDRSSKPSMGGPWMEDSLQKGAEIVTGYRLVRRIGQGGYGTVWEARAPGGRPVALKIICNLEAGTGRQEFKALELIKSLNHLHLLELHAYWLLDAEGGVIPDDVWNEPSAPNANTLVIATKLAQMNLQQRLHECQQTGTAGIPADELIGYMRQAALAIDYLNEPRHSQESQVVSIQHRDIKPENILLVGGGTVQVGDFGLARVLEGTSEAVRRESRAFTPPYAAPELYTDKVTRWTDQYALALTYYKLRTGVLPFSENFGRTEIMMAHVEGKLDLSRLPETEKVVIARATSLRSEARFPTCLAMVDGLERALKADFPLAEPEPLLRPRVDRHLLQTSPYTPDSVPEAPPVAAMAGTTAYPSTRLGTATKQDLYFTDPGTDAASITNTPKTVQHPTEPAPAVSATPARRAWVQPVERSALSPTKAVLIILLAVGISAGAFAAFSWYKGRNGGLASGDTSKALPSTSSVTTPPTAPQKAANPQAATVIAEIDGKLREGDKAYAGNDLPTAAKAFQGAWDLSKQHAIATHFNKPIFGLAKTFARQAEAGERPWVDIPPLLAELRSGELDPANAVRRDLLLRLAAAHGTSPRPVTDADLELLDRLNTHASGEVLDQWEESQRQSMQKQVADAILKRMDLVADDVSKDFEELEPVFRTGNKLAAIVKTSEPDVRQLQSKVLDSVWKLAGSDRSKGLPFEAYAKHEDAQHAKRCMEKLQALTKEAGGNLTPEHEHELGLALWHGTDEKDAVRERVARLLDSCKPGDSIDYVPHLLVKAKVQPRGYVGSKTAFQTYDAIYQNLRKNKKGKVLEWYELLLLPAIEHGRRALNYQTDITNASELALKEQVGKCYLAKATLLGEFPGVIVDNWELERMKAGEEATKLWEDPGLLLTVCDWHMKWASKSPKRSQPQREYLEKALDDAGKAVAKATEPKLQSRALNAKGLIQEELGVLFTERERYAAALADYSTSVDRDASNPRYLVDRGRCWFRQNQFGILNDKAKQAVALENAKKDLQQALEKLPGEQQSDAWYWLGMTYRRQEKPDFRNAKDSFVQAFEHLDSKQNSTEFLSDVLMALLNVGEVLYWDSLEWDPKGGVKRIRDAEKLDLAAQAFHHFGRMIQKVALTDYSAIKSEVPRFTIPPGVGKDDFAIYANGRLRDLADGYWFDPDKKSMDKVLELTRLGIPDNPLESTHYHVYCLNRRNVLYGLQMDKLSQPQRRELDDKLLAEADHAVKSAGHRLIPTSFLVEAHLAAYQLYLNKKDHAKAREHLQKILSVPGLAAERKQEVEKLLEKIKE